MMLLQDIVVADFSQFLSGPSAGLRLADFGAEVIKIERPVVGDICRSLYVSDVELEGESTIFHAINRNKKSFVADLKSETGLEKVKKIIARADVLIHNFRPGVMEGLGLSYEDVQGINPGIVYGEISGYGKSGPWRDKPGQDLLVQAVSGLACLSGNRRDPPTPMGVSVADIYSGAHLVQGILAGLYQKNITGKGVLVQVSLLESILDFQFEVITCYYNDGHQLPERSEISNANAFVAAPYGIYGTVDGWLALAMSSIPVLGELLKCPALTFYKDSGEWFSKRDEIKLILSDHIKTQSTRYWLNILEPADIWASEVLDYERLINHDGYKTMKMEQEVIRGNNVIMKTTRCPVRVDGERLTSSMGAPSLGQHNLEIEKQFQII
jgi:crotonobetainyl-CoA:carnitine CoA-transferase CaiB-like acyl-CoA transferase